MYFCIAGHSTIPPKCSSVDQRFPAKFAMLRLVARTSRCNPGLALRAFSDQVSSATGDQAAADSQLPPNTPFQGAGFLSIQPPATVPWSAEHVNSVTLTGTVLTNPVLQHTKGSQMVTNAMLSLRQPSNRAAGKQQSVALESWGYNALQLAQYVRKGMQVQVQAHLKESIWTERTTNQDRRKLKVVVDSLRIVAAPPEQEAAAAEAHAGPSPSQEPPAPALTRAMETVHHMFQEGLSLQEIAAARGVTISTVVDYVIKAAGFGLAVDWKRLAGALQLGPKDSPWLTGDEVWAAVEASCQEQFPGCPVAEQLMSLKLRPVRDTMEAQQDTMARLALQESLGGKWVTYGQIKLVIMMRKQGVDWNDVVTDPPPPLPEAVPVQEQGADGELQVVESSDPPF